MDNQRLGAVYLLASGEQPLRSCGLFPVASLTGQGPALTAGLGSICWLMRWRDSLPSLHARRERGLGRCEPLQLAPGAQEWARGLVGMAVRFLSHWPEWAEPRAESSPRADMTFDPEFRLQSATRRSWVWNKAHFHSPPAFVNQHVNRSIRPVGEG